MDILIVRMSLIALACGVSLACGSTERGGPEAEAAGPLTYIDCGLAPRDAVLNSTASQRQGVISPSTFDNPGCDDYYIVEFDGTVSGVPYGYRLETPTSPDQGITLSFAGLTPLDVSLHPTICEHSFARAFLYEQQSNGTWGYVTSKLIVGQAVATVPGIYHCSFPVMTFSQVIKGTAAHPHIYRVAATTYVDSAYGAAFPDNVGYGPIRIFGSD